MNRRLDKGEQQMIHYQQALGSAFRETSSQLNKYKKTLFWQSRKYYRLKTEGEELDLILSICRSYKIPPLEQAMINALQQLENSYMDGVNGQMTPEQRATLDKCLKISKTKLHEDERDAELSEEIISVVKRYIHLMENRLQVKTVEFGKQYTELSKLRAELSSLQCRLTTFEAMCSRLDALHNDASFRMQKLVRVSSNAHRKKEEANTKIVSLNERIEHNENLYRFEMNEIDRNAFNAMNFEEFISVLVQEREVYSLDIYLKKNEKELATRRRQLNEYMKAFSKIKEVSGYLDIKSTISRFQNKRSDNFSLFRFLVEIHSEIGNLNAEMNILLPIIAKKQQTYLHDHAVLRRTLHNIQNLDQDEVEAADSEADEIEQSKEALIEFKLELIELMEVIGSDVSTLKNIDDIVSNTKLIKQSIIDIHEKVNQLVQLKMYYDRHKLSQNVYDPNAYRKHHTLVSTPTLTFLE
ncbi:uncharacterized protein LOC115224478 [Octopus sinensis]|uniref:Uncharacterized protein LOC115224478 n=1 Tax=Octopus sinensis TaxID=2607531 RepID=A0A6P7TQM1_9MOLL|nr:uncharacterized protein LOC115224478 [Octopus sinensis]